MDNLPSVYFSNGVFLVYDEFDVLRLRKKRILGTLIGCSSKNPYQISVSGLPYHINHYAADIILEEKLAIFKKLVAKPDISVNSNLALYDNYLKSIKEEERRRFLDMRKHELIKRKIEPTSSRIGQFDEKKIRLTVPDTSQPNYTTYSSVRLDKNDISPLLQLVSNKKLVFRDLYQRGFYVGLGTKFGSDFLVYPGDPVMYHAQYAVRILENAASTIDLDKIDFNEINALHRLCHTANKIPLFAIVYSTTDCLDIIKYFSLRSREYLTSDSDTSAFEPLDPKFTRPPLVLRKADADIAKKQYINV